MNRWNAKQRIRVIADTGRGKLSPSHRSHDWPGAVVGKSPLTTIAHLGMAILGVDDFAVTHQNGRTTFSFCCPSQKEIDFVTEANSANTPASSNKVSSNSPCPCGSGRNTSVATAPLKLKLATTEIMVKSRVGQLLGISTETSFE